MKSKIDYYRRTPKIDTSGYIRDFKEYYLKQKIDNESDDAKIISMLSTISPQDFLHQNFNKYNISAQGLNYLKKLHFNFSKSKSMGHYDRQSELISKGISQTPSDLTPQDIINLDKSLTHFDSITINWAMSFDHCVNPDGSIRIDEAKKCYDFCKENGKKIRALGAIYPTVANRLQAENISSEELESVFENYMKSLSEACPNIDSMDIVNELSYDFGQSGAKGEYPKDKPLLNNSFLQDKMGENYYIKLMQIARKYFPNTKFIYNDFAHENTEKAENIFKIVQKIQDYEKENGVKILDGIGMQCRLDSNNTKLDNLEKVIDRAEALGLIVQITELDVVKMSKDDNGNLLSESEASKRQEDVYSKIHEIAFAKRDVVESITYGDMTDKLSWSATTDRYIDEPDPSPTVYNNDGEPKSNIVSAINRGIDRGLERNPEKQSDNKNKKTSASTSSDDEMNNE